MQQYNSFVTMEEYTNDIEEEFEVELEVINDYLIMGDSFSRGEMLHYSIYECDIEHLKYYLFDKWWGRIDAGHNLFNSSDVEKWLAHSFVKLDLSDLNFDAQGYVTVYRGESKNSNSYKNGAMSWTTSSDVAEMFARGARERTVEVENPVIIMGKVHKDKIIGRFDGRGEFELLCKDVTIQEEIKLK